MATYIKDTDGMFLFNYWIEYGTLETSPRKSDAIEFSDNEDAQELLDSFPNSTIPDDDGYYFMIVEE